jgi:hypothetical protein
MRHPWSLQAVPGQGRGGADVDVIEDEFGQLPTGPGAALVAGGTLLFFLVGIVDLATPRVA